MQKMNFIHSSQKFNFKIKKFYLLIHLLYFNSLNQLYSIQNFNFLINLNHFYFSLIKILNLILQIYQHYIISLIINIMLSFLIFKHHIHLISLLMRRFIIINLNFKLINFKFLNLILTYSLNLNLNYSNITKVQQQFIYYFYQLFKN